MDIVSISTFRNSLLALCKRTEYGYGSCPIDICNELSGKSYDDVSAMSFLVREIGNVKIIKLRLQNSRQNLSKADGFRLIILCNAKYNEVALLTIYPKRGKYAKMDLGLEEYKQLLKEYGEEKKNNSLVEHNIKEALAQV